MNARLALLMLVGLCAGFLAGAYFVENSHADDMVCTLAPSGYTHCTLHGQGVCRTVILYNATDSECVWDV